MTDRTEREQEAATGRGGDRRGGDRRGGERRLPPPPWRRPWALVAYGVVGALILVAVVSSFGDEEETGRLEVTTAPAPPQVDPNATPAADAPPRDAFTVGDFERLLAEGAEASGQRVRTLLYCQPTSVVALRDVEGVSESVAALADAERRVPAADCKWSADEGAPDILVLVPPALAQQFAAMPEVEQAFVRRRRVPAEIEWLGRSDALSLRTAGVLRRIEAE